MKRWVYNEYIFSGIDYSKNHEAKKFNKIHKSFRNFKNEFEDILNLLPKKKLNNMTMLDIGCGTGIFSLYFSKIFKEVYAMDISDAMLEQIKQDIITSNIVNIKVVKSGFLDIDNKILEPIDFVISNLVFHHLPDFWKQIALLKINKILKINSYFYISDVIFNFPVSEYEEVINKWLSKYEESQGIEFKKRVEMHLKNEYSTFNWIFESMLKNAGFKIIKKNSHKESFISSYFCQKIIQAQV
jgi:ubiquinone/menaquinone biosynthesis C-methylase UbiE